VVCLSAVRPVFSTMLGTDAVTEIPLHFCSFFKKLCLAARNRRRY
jgi:hypothetical protein